MKIIMYVFLLMIAGICVLAIFSFFENRRFRIQKYNIEHPKIPAAFDGYRICFLTDMHNHEFGEHNRKLISAIEQMQPDIILLGGDMLIGKAGAPYENALRLVRELTGRFPVYMALGNHEYRLKLYRRHYTEMWKEYYRKTCEYGAFWLDNDTVRIERDGAQIALSGLSITRKYYKRRERQVMEADFIRKRLPMDDRSCFQIMLAHNPDYFPAYAEYGADLVLSGHVHGGIIRIPFLGGVISPCLKLFPHYDRGLFDEFGSKMIISGGLGGHSIPVRVCNVPELTEITLLAKTSKS